MNRDETDRTPVDEALRASEERYRDLFENANDVVFTTDLQMRFTSLNRAGETITGYAREEALNLTVAQVVPPEYLEQIQQRMQEHLAGRVMQPFEAEIIAKDGRRIPMEVSSRLMSRGGRPEGIQGIARDISERKRLEGELRQAQRMEVVGRLVGGIAHDFNNLLTVILGQSSELVECLDPSDPRREQAREICQAAQSAANLTRQLLAFSRRQILHPRVIDLSRIVMGLTDMLRRLVGSDVRLVTHAARDLYPIKADPGQIEQIIMNLVANARDAMPAGGRLTIETANTEMDAQGVAGRPGLRPGPYVRLTVADTGVGMDAETRSQIFEPFFTTKESGKGTGLGLATVYGIVKQSGAYISVHTEEGRGSVFEVYFPKVADKPSAHRSLDEGGSSPLAAR